jgi:hypothetical protein
VPPFAFAVAPIYHVYLDISKRFPAMPLCRIALHHFRLLRPSPPQFHAHSLLLTQIPALLIVDNYDKQFAPYQWFAKQVMQETRGIGFGWWSSK